MHDQANTACGQKAIERVDMFTAIQEFQQRLNAARNRLEAISGRVNGYGPEGENCKEIPPQSLRERLEALCAPLGDIEHFIARLDKAIGGDTPQPTKMPR